MSISTGIPVPPRGRIVAVLSGMEVGASVLVKTRNEANSIRIAASRLNYLITQRKDRGGIRIWRTA